MVGSRILLFLLGACIASAHVLRNGKPCGHKHPPGTYIELTKPEVIAEFLPAANLMDLATPELPPFLSHFTQQGSNLFYKPHITLAPSHMPMPVPVVELKKDCKKEPELPKIEELPEFILPVPQDELVEIRPMPIPYAPELPPFIMPELPLVVVEEPVPPAPLPIIPDAPIVEVHEYRPMDIPQAPELPPLVLPELPTPVKVEVVPPHVPVIPMAPELPPFIMPEMPTIVYAEEPSKAPCHHAIPERVIVPEAPKLPEIAIHLPMPIKEIEIKPIPEAPELPPFVMPELPVVVYEEPAYIPFAPLPAVIPDAPAIEVHEYKPVEIPPAPVLPPFTLPELPVPIGFEVLPAPVLPALPAASLPAEEPVQVVEYRPVEIPAAPELPHFVMPAIPEPVIIERFDESDKPAVVIKPIPSSIALPYPLPVPAQGQFPFATFCAENIIIERVLPNLIMSDKLHEKSLIPAGIKYPVFPTPYYAPAVY